MGICFVAVLNREWTRIDANFRVSRACFYSRPFAVFDLNSTNDAVGFRQSKCELWLDHCRPSGQRALFFSFAFDAVKGCFLAEHVVVVLGESVGFVADILQQSQGERMFAQPMRFRLAGDEDFFLALGQ